MYRSHWGLRETPFRTSLDTRFFYQSPIQEEALARLQFLVDERRRVGLCLGESGSGKSLLLEVFASKLRRRGCQLVNLNLFGIELHEFLWLTAAELGVNPDRRASEFSLWRDILDRIAENRYQQLETVILLDDADHAPSAVLDTIVRLAESDRSPAARLTLVLAAAPDQVAKLGDRLIAMADLRVDLEPWDIIDTVGYLHYALRQAGRREPIFRDEAMLRLHELSDGVPRRVVQLANLAMLAGAGRGDEQVEAETVESVCRELGAVEMAG